MAMETDQLVSILSERLGPKNKNKKILTQALFIYIPSHPVCGVKQYATKYLGFLIFIKKSKGEKKKKNNTTHQTRIPETTNSFIVIPTLWLLCIPGMDHWPPLLSINHCQSWLCHNQFKSSFTL